MAVQSRQGRAPRSAGGQFASKASKASKAAVAQQAPISSHHHSNNADDTPSSLLDTDGRPGKRRKIEIRGPKQSTLDDWASKHASQSKPPTKVTVTQPHGQLVETLNGVKTELYLDGDDLASGLNDIATSSRVLQPANGSNVPVAKQEDKRTLRSQEQGPRLKSELAIYFEKYEDIIFDTPQDPQFITVDTSLYITDDAPRQVKSEQSSPSKSPRNVKPVSAHDRTASTNGVPPPLTPQRSSANEHNGAQTLDFSPFARSLPDQPDDPLTDEVFIKSHKRAERKEKQLRNIERERAMHEKVQLERLLDGLLGHDWLKVLGITGVTDGEAKKYESKRDYFIAEVQSLVNKFKEWKEAEKQQRLEKEAAAAREREETEDQETEEGSVEPPSSDLNASAAKQLQQEIGHALKSSSAPKTSNSKDKDRVPAMPPMPIPYRPPSPVMSFFDKRHIRDASLKKTRHGRNVLAFGHPLPEMDLQEFELPEDYLTEDTLRANAREKRRRKRESVANAGS